MVSLMTEVGVHEAKTRLSALLRRVEAGEEVVVTRGGKAVARIVPAEPAPPAITRFGLLAAEVGNPGDWDSDDSDELADLFGVGHVDGP